MRGVFKSYLFTTSLSLFYGNMTKRTARKSTGVEESEKNLEAMEYAQEGSSPKGSKAFVSSPRQSENSLERDDESSGTPEKARFPVCFSDLFKDNRKPDEASKCSYIPSNDSGSIEIPKSDVRTFTKSGASAFSDVSLDVRFPGLKAIQALVDSWKVKCSILAHYNGWILFQFEQEKDLNKVLAEGPYFVFGRGLLLRTPPENFCFLSLMKILV